MNIDSELSSSVEKVEFWFDPVCPWTWITSRWMAEVNETKDLNVTWQPFSLKVLNGDNDAGDFKVWHENGHKLGMLLMAIKEKFGNDTVAAVYTELGQKIHLEKREDINEIISESLQTVGLDAEIVEIGNSDEYDKALRESTQRGLDLVGPGVGVPIIAIDEKAFFGPVVSPAPKGKDALKLWQAVYLSITTPGFSELKRGRSGGLNFD